MSREIEKRIKKELKTISEILEEIDFYDEEKLRNTLKHTLKEYGSLLKGNINLLKKISNNRKLR